MLWLFMTCTIAQFVVPHPMIDDIGAVAVEFETLERD
jgi:hypothetical protein